VGYAYRDRLASTIPHLWVVFASPASDPDERAIVSVTSDGQHISDRSCPLNKGDHQAIDHLSFALFRKARVVTERDLAAWHANNYVVPEPAVGGVIVDRIRQAALQSPFTPRNVQAAVRDCLWVLPAPATD
jgi:hypothetical protein